MNAKIKTMHGLRRIAKNSAALRLNPLRLTQGILLMILSSTIPVTAKSAVTFTTALAEKVGYGVLNEPLLDGRQRALNLSLNHKDTPAVSNEPKRLSIEKRPTIQQKLSKIDLYNLKAEDFYNQGLKERSMKIWELILRLSPNHMPTLNNLARAYFNARRFKASESLFLRLSRLDKTSWHFPNARFFTAMAYYKQYGDVENVHRLLLNEFLKNDPKKYRKEAQQLRLVAIDKVNSSRFNSAQVGSFRKNLKGSPRTIIHFWAEWCTPCLKELSELFKFRSQHPDIRYLIVSIDSEDAKMRADKRINQIYAPFKSPHSENLQFVFDPQKLLWKSFIPSEGGQTLTVPRTLFLEQLESIAYIPRQIDWASIDVTSLWKKNNGE